MGAWLERGHSLVVPATGFYKRRVDGQARGIGVHHEKALSFY